LQLEKHFDVDASPEQAAAVLGEDETLTGLFPDAETEIVERRSDRKTVLSRYRILGREGEATFHFHFREDGGVAFEKVCDGRVWKLLRGEVRFAARGKRTRVTLAMEGRTKGLVPEFTIRGPLQEQIEEMAKALRARIRARV
jgi:hypothetical protein